ncbi:MAG: hypothetical protein JXA28_12715 [Bacteroidetes bacterium]|nr:hypothetical protein [Bacteroidota bacterium]
MKHFSALFLSICILVALTACSEENPSVRVRNDLDKKVNVQLKPAAGNTININDVEPGSTSATVDVEEGVWTATAAIQSLSITPEQTFQADNDMLYTVVIVNTDPPGMQVLSEDK